MKFTHRVLAQIIYQANATYLAQMKIRYDPPDMSAEAEKRILDGITAVARNDVVFPQDSHDNWLAYMVAEGWKYGPVKDELKKQHPAMLPFDDLPIQIQLQDIMFLALVTELLPFVEGE